MISKDEWKVAHVMRRTCCTRETAVDYLDAEEWDEADAVISLDGAKHTPGPWVLCVADDDSDAYTIFSEDQLIDGRIEAGVWDDRVASAGLNHDNYEANARLIAAAPELLAAADRAESFISGFDDDNTQDDVAGMLRDLRTAIAKATGSEA